MPKIKVLYIGGFGRSGSTLIDMMFGKVPGFFPAGELRWIWTRCFEQNQLTAEGVPFRESPFWTKVINKAYGGFDRVDLPRVLYLRNQVDRIRYIPQMRDPSRRTDEFRKDFNEFTAILDKLYQAIYEVSGAEILVDSSKYPPYGYLLNAMDYLEVYMLHLVRDSRAVAYSWQRTKVRPEIHWQKQSMPKFGVVRSSRNWMSNNYLCERFNTIDPKRYLLMRYEDFVQAPQENFKKILEFVGKGDADISFLEGGKFEPVPIQSVAGNPIRFEKKEIVIRSDTEWQKQMPDAEQALVTAMTSPLLWHYGYLTRR
jgi:hypothetical protein